MQALVSPPTPSTLELSDLWRHLSASQQVLMKIAKPFTKNSVQGAQTSIFCAVESSLEKETGGYYRYSHYSPWKLLFSSLIKQQCKPHVLVSVLCAPLFHSLCFPFQRLRCCQLLSKGKRRWSGTKAVGADLQNTVHHLGIATWVIWNTTTSLVLMEREKM